MRSVLVEPNGHTYLALIDVYKTARDPDGAKHAWRHMREAGVRPVSPAVSSVMSVLAKKGDLSAAEAGHPLQTLFLFRLMLIRSQIPHALTCNYSELGDLQS